MTMDFISVVVVLITILTTVDRLIVIIIGLSFGVRGYRRSRNKSTEHLLRSAFPRKANIGIHIFNRTINAVALRN